MVKDKEDLIFYLNLPQKSVTIASGIFKCKMLFMMGNQGYILVFFNVHFYCFNLGNLT